MAHAASETPARVTWVAVPLRGSQTGTHRRSTPGQAEGSWVPDPCFLSSSPPPPACAVALTLQQTPLGQRLQQEKKKQHSPSMEDGGEGAGEAGFHPLRCVRYGWGKTSKRPCSSEVPFLGPAAALDQECSISQAWLAASSLPSTQGAGLGYAGATPA